MKFSGLYTAGRDIKHQYTVFFKWFFISVISGAVIGIAGSVFHGLLDLVTETRIDNSFLLYLLPFGGLVIVFLYRKCGMESDKGTNGIILGARGEENVSLKTAPLIVIATLITHLLGGSAGREGAALQLGGSMISPVGKLLKLKHKDYSMLIMCGMAAGFSSLFGTPAAAAIFAIEVTVVGIAHYSAIVPCLISSITAAMISDMFKLTPTSFNVAYVPNFQSDSYITLIKVICLGILCSMISIFFCYAMRNAAKIYKKLFENPYLRIFVGGCIVIAITKVIFFITGSYDYSGAGTDIIKLAFAGECRPEAFLIKIILTALTLGCGFKGGEIVPTLFIGATFGCFFGSTIGLSASFGAALGLAAFFCGVTNCPFASLILAIELFGAEGLPYYALVIGIAYMLSGFIGLYSAQKFYDKKLAHGHFSRIHSYSEIKHTAARLKNNSDNSK